MNKSLKEAIRLAAEEGARLALEGAKVGPEYFTTPRAAEYLSCSTQWLEIGRHRGYGPIFVKLSRMVRYKRSDLDDYMAAREQHHG